MGNRKRKLIAVDDVMVEVEGRQSVLLMRIKSLAIRSSGGKKSTGGKSRFPAEGRTCLTVWRSGAMEAQSPNGLSHVAVNYCG